MSSNEFLSLYKQYFAEIIAGLGIFAGCIRLLLQVVYDYKAKRMQIRQTAWEKSRLQHVEEFLSLYAEMKRLWDTFPYKYLSTNNPYPSKEYDALYDNQIRKLESKAYICSIYVDKTTSDHMISIVKNLHSLSWTTMNIMSAYEVKRQVASIDYDRKKKEVYENADADLASIVRAVARAYK